jgi:hypothetical protein
MESLSWKKRRFSKRSANNVSERRLLKINGIAVLVFVRGVAGKLPLRNDDWVNVALQDLSKISLTTKLKAVNPKWDLPLF